MINDETSKKHFLEAPTNQKWKYDSIFLEDNA